MKFCDFVMRMKFAYEKRGEIKINLRIDGEYINTVDVTLVKERIKSNEMQDYYSYEVERWYYPTDECMTVCLTSRKIKI